MSKARDIANAEEESYNRLGDINAPTLVTNVYGRLVNSRGFRRLVDTCLEDTMVPTINSFVLLQEISTDFLHVFQDAGHGFLVQKAELFAKQVNTFLNGW